MIKDDDSKNLKDNSFKDIFGNKQLFYEFIKDYIQIDIFKDITPDDIEDISGRFIDAFNENRDSDTVKQINLKDNNLFVLCLVEHQSSVKYLMSFRMLEYMVLIWKDYIKKITEEAQKINKNAEPSELKRFRLPPILPIVFYEGKGNWTAEVQFKEKVFLNEVFEKYIPKFEYRVVNLNNYTKEDLLEIPDLLSLIFLIDKVKSPKEFKLLKDIPKEYVEKVTKDTSEELLKMLARIIKSFLERVNAPREEIDHIVDQVYKRRFIEMFTMLEEYDVQATRREAREKGIEEGIEKGEYEKAVQIAKNMLDEGISLKVISRLTDLPIEVVHQLASSKDISLQQ